MTTDIDIKKITAELETVLDPEVPVLTVMDLGIIRNVAIENGVVRVLITPTYTGCPAMQWIEMNIRAAIENLGYQVEIQTILTPPWTTDWMSESGKMKLKEYGIAPPVGKAGLNPEAFGEKAHVLCPRCSSQNTERISEFGSTACKALYRCLDCKEPFDYFKCH
ncbi:MAG: phenylacetate-CoA oxygenase subunit PaaJ [Saprospiraceae bacterium]|nr:phenylacetate-CoA oxygenase subunit PaaJ [Saprospiraceae bacterium]